MSERRVIQLSQGKVATVDADMYEWLMQWKWSALKKVTHAGLVRWYAIRNTPRPQKRFVYMHIALLCPPAGAEVDHKDGDGLHNWLENLRVATHQENLMNRQHLALNKTSIHLGVSWHAKTRKWRANITLDGKQIYLGLFANEDDAARARDAASRRYFGQFARMNFPVEDVILC